MSEESSEWDNDFRNSIKEKQSEKFERFMDSSEKCEVTFMSIEELENMYKNKVKK